ncbi:MAG: hypothetical protein FWD60_00395 [Candidatus Azobacteroides sp.]|nr:hypothetical protein [Candidatus Azobacteroides sp.]
MKRVIYLIATAVFMCGCSEDNNVTVTSFSSIVITDTIIVGIRPDSENSSLCDLKGIIIDANGKFVNDATVTLGIGTGSTENFFPIAVLEKVFSGRDGQDGQYEFTGINTDLSDYSSKYVAEVYHYIIVSKSGDTTKVKKIELQPGKIIKMDIQLQ